MVKRLKIRFHPMLSNKNNKREAFQTDKEKMLLFKTKITQNTKQKIK